MNKQLVSWSLLILCNLMWALQFTCIKLTQDQVGPYATVWGPMLLATLLLLPFAWRDRKKAGKQLKDMGVFVQLALLGAFPAQVLMTWGTQYSQASNAAILTLALPIVTAVFACLLLKEKMTKARWWSFIIAICGVLLCSLGDLRKMNFGATYAIGNLLIFLAIAGNAYYNVGIKKIADRYTEMEMVFYTYVVLVVLLTPLVLVYEPAVFKLIPSFTRDTWTGLLLLTFFHNFLSMILFFRALKKLEAIQVAFSNYLITLMGLPVAAIWLGERLSHWAWLGGILVLLATLLITILDYRKAVPLPPVSHSDN